MNEGFLKPEEKKSSGGFKIALKPKKYGTVRLGHKMNKHDLFSFNVTTGLTTYAGKSCRLFNNVSVSNQTVNTGNFMCRLPDTNKVVSLYRGSTASRPIVFCEEVNPKLLSRTKGTEVEVELVSTVALGIVALNSKLAAAFYTSGTTTRCAIVENTTGNTLVVRSTFQVLDNNPSDIHFDVVLISEWTISFAWLQFNNINIKTIKILESGSTYSLELESTGLIVSSGSSVQPRLSVLSPNLILAAYIRGTIVYTCLISVNSSLAQSQQGTETLVQNVVTVTGVIDIVALKGDFAFVAYITNSSITQGNFIDVVGTQITIRSAVAFNLGGNQLTAKPLAVDEKTAMLTISGALYFLIVEEFLQFRSAPSIGSVSTAKSCNVVMDEFTLFTHHHGINGDVFATFFKIEGSVSGILQEGGNSAQEVKALIF
jgi:hypothetical protein